jgi:hypothetical protein
MSPELAFVIGLILGVLICHAELLPIKKVRKVPRHEPPSKFHH